MLKYPLNIDDLKTRNPIVAVSNIMDCFRLLCVHYIINLITYSVRAYIFSLYFQRGPLMIICTCYIMVVWILKKKQQQVLPHSGTTVQKLTTTAIMICLFFMILTMPVTVYSFFLCYYKTTIIMVNNVFQFLGLLKHTI